MKVSHSIRSKYGTWAEKVREGWLQRCLDPLDPLNYGFCDLLDVGHVHSDTEPYYLDKQRILSHFYDFYLVYVEKTDPKFTFYI